MDDLIILGGAALIASIMTFFTGFGLGTIMLPVFALFFDTALAIALTGVVHLVNNLFKFLLLRKSVNTEALVKFGIPAVAGAVIGALILVYALTDHLLYSYILNGTVFNVTLINLVIGILMIGFAVIELFPVLSAPLKNRLVLGGLLSGFFGGLSGHQGALRSLFLIKFGLSKEAFIATGVVIACFVDVARIGTYAKPLMGTDLSTIQTKLIVACGAAIAGAVIGRLTLKKMPIGSLQVIVSVAILVFALAIGSGLVS